MMLLLLLLLQVVAAAVAVSTTPPACTYDGDQAPAAIAVEGAPEPTCCVILFDGAWRLLATVVVNETDSTFHINSTAADQTVFIEFYADTQCMTYISDCTVAQQKIVTKTFALIRAAPSATATGTPTASPSPVPRVPRGIRAMYVWDLSDCLFNTLPSSVGAFADVCQAQDYLTLQDHLINNVLKPWNTFPSYNRIYLEVEITTVINNAAMVRSFLAKAHSYNISVEFLAGNATWVTTADNALIPQGYCDTIVNFNTGSSKQAEWFDGIHLDIEPHTLGQSWLNSTPGAPDRYNQIYEANLLAIFRHCMNVTRRTTMTVTWDCGNDYYLFVHGLWTPLVSNDPFVDYLTIMNYYSNETWFLYGGHEDGGVDVGGVKNIIHALDGILPAVFAADCSPPPTSQPWETFWIYGTSAALESTEATAVSIFGQHSSFAGTATHQYQSYFELPPSIPTPTSQGSSLHINVYFIIFLISIEWMLH